MDEIINQPNPPLILIADDDRSIRFLLRRVLERDGYMLEEAENGVQALSAYERLQPEVVLLDAMMPGLDGFTTCTRLRALPGGDRTPVLMITALSDNESVDRAFEVGATDYLIKPIHYAVVRQRVRRLLHAYRTEVALRQSEERYRFIYNKTPAMLHSIDREGQLIRVSDYWLETLGYERSEVLGHKFSDFLTAESRRYAQEVALPVFFKTGLSKDIPYQLVKKNGEIIDILLSGVAKWNEAGGMEYSLTVMIDITERNQMQVRMMATQKLADLGTLAAGVAHEINSPLQVITGLSQNLIDRFDQRALDPDHLRHQLEIIHRNGWRCAEIVRSLRTYAHASATQVEPNDLNTLVQDTLLLIEHQLKSWSNITIITNLAPKLPPLPCDRNQITQVLINLLTNARDAITEMGEITIYTGYDPESSRLNLQVTDTGPGIPESIQAKIFDPFFTTKSLGQGTGLGLSIVAGIVHAYGGEIKVDSIPNVGTTFTLLFPTEAKLMTIAATTVTRGRFDDTVYPLSNSSEPSSLTLPEITHG